MNNDYFAVLPLNLIYEQKYANLSSNAIILYCLFLNRTKLSTQNKKFKDDKGVFIYYSTVQISNHLNCSVNSAKKALCELEKMGLIRKECQQNGLPIKIYVNDIRSESKGTNFPRKKEKEVSFDVEKAREMELKHLYNFAEKKKRRTRNVGPTLW